MLLNKPTSDPADIVDEPTTRSWGSLGHHFVKMVNGSNPIPSFEKMRPR